ncbi:MAG: glycosyltransferase family 2 protein, partial [Candidatus Micrarchaeaceae archaeon]
MSEHELSVIMPAYNEESVIRHSIASVAETLKIDNIDYELIVVDDGSTDSTRKYAMEYQNDRTKIIGYAKNRGKGYALKYGFQYSDGKYVIFFDSDLNILPEEIANFLKIIKSEGRDIVIGSKRLSKSVINYPFLRRILSIVYHLYVKALFRLEIMDTQV